MYLSSAASERRWIGYRDNCATVFRELPRSGKFKSATEQKKQFAPTRSRAPADCSDSFHTFLFLVLILFFPPFVSLVSLLEHSRKYIKRRFSVRKSPSSSEMSFLKTIQSSQAVWSEDYSICLHHHYSPSRDTFMQSLASLQNIGSQCRGRFTPSAPPTRVCNPFKAT